MLGVQRFRVQGLGVKSLGVWVVLARTPGELICQGGFQHKTNACSPSIFNRTKE